MHIVSDQFANVFIIAPGSPKSCMKGSRKLTFEEKGGGGGDSSGEVTMTDSATSTVSKSPKKSSKVCIRSPGDNSSPVTAPTVVVPPFVKPPDIQFSQHYDQSTPPPNCTSNGYDFAVENSEETSSSSDSTDPRQDPHLMEVASKFVNEIIETATLEASNRQKVVEKIDILLFAMYKTINLL